TQPAGTDSWVRKSHTAAGGRELRRHNPLYYRDIRLTQYQENRHKQATRNRPPARTSGELCQCGSRFCEAFRVVENLLASAVPDLPEPGTRSGTDEARIFVTTLPCTSVRGSLCPGSSGSGSAAPSPGIQPGNSCTGGRSQQPVPLPPADEQSASVLCPDRLD